MHGLSLEDNVSQTFSMTAFCVFITFKKKIDDSLLHTCTMSSCLNICNQLDLCNLGQNTICFLKGDRNPIL